MYIYIYILHIYIYIFIIFYNIYMHIYIYIYNSTKKPCETLHRGHGISNSKFYSEHLQSIISTE